MEPDNQDAAADVWRSLGFEFVEILLDDVSLRVLLDWTRGVEIISPTTSEATVCAARAFLNDQGEGIYSVVVRTEAINTAIDSMRSRGAKLTYQQSRVATAIRFKKRSSHQRSECRSHCSKQTWRGNDDPSTGMTSCAGRKDSPRRVLSRGWVSLRSAIPGREVLSASTVDRALVTRDNR